ncbi:hypothetical protein BJ742DRAFT_371869 [Cladochytrium replicatum]|nr:hypothetical protein BJ742DRAFT_371869 [Cladochytrium replicatum]
MPESVSSQFASTFPNHYKSATELCVGGINGLINMEGSRLGGTFYRDVTFSPGQILTGFINLNVSDRSQKELMGGAKLKSEVFSVVLKCDVSIYNLTQMKATGGENHFTYTASHAPMYSGDAGLAKVAIQAALRKAVGQHNATLFCFEVPVDDNGEFTIQIPDSILLPPDIVCDLGRLTYTLCPISHRNKFTGHEFSLVMNNNLPSQQQHLFPKKLPLMPPAEHTGVIPGKVHVSAFTSSASMDVTIVAGSLYTAVLGTQTVHTMITLQPGAHAILNAKNLVFCDVKAEFVNRISSKGGKHRLDYVSGEVSARASLRALLADQEQNASETVTLTLEV